MAGRRGRLVAPAIALLATVLAGGCGSTGSSSATPTTAGGPLVAPKTDPVTDGQYLTELSEADPDLATYATQQGQAGLQALLTDGSAFCAFLLKTKDLDTAMFSLAEGARSVESKTSLPSSVETFNAIDAVSLLTLCPSEQQYVPPATRAKIQALGQTLAGHTGSVSSPSGG